MQAEGTLNAATNERNYYQQLQHRIQPNENVKYVGDAEAPDFENVFVVSSELCCNSNEISVTNFSESFVKESFFLQLKFC